MCYSYPVLLNQFGEVTSAFRQMVFNSDCNNVWPHFMGVILCVYQYFILGHFFTIFLQRRLLNTEVADYYVIFKLPYCLGDMVTNMYMVNIFLNEILAQFDIGWIQKQFFNSRCCWSYQQTLATSTVGIFLEFWNY